MPAEGPGLELGAWQGGVKGRGWRESRRGQGDETPLWDQQPEAAGIAGSSSFILGVMAGGNLSLLQLE